MALSMLPPATAFAFLTYSSAKAVYKAQGEPSEIAFVLSLYTLVAGLFWAILTFERTPRNQQSKRDRLVAAIWAISVALNMSFTYRVADILSSDKVAYVWCIAAAVSAIGFWLCFL